MKYVSKSALLIASLAVILTLLLRLAETAMAGTASGIAFYHSSLIIDMLAAFFFPLAGKLLYQYVDKNEDRYDENGNSLIVAGSIGVACGAISGTLFLMFGLPVIVIIGIAVAAWLVFVSWHKRAIVSVAVYFAGFAIAAVPFYGFVFRTHWVFSIAVLVAWLAVKIFWGPVASNENTGQLA